MLKKLTENHQTLSVTYQVGILVVYFVRSCRLSNSPSMWKSRRLAHFVCTVAVVVVVEANRMVRAIEIHCGYEWNVGSYSNPAWHTSVGNDPFAVVVHCERQKGWRIRREDTHLQSKKEGRA